MRCLRVSLFAVISVLLFSSAATGQPPGIVPRVAGPVDDRSLVVFSGNVPSVARAEFDQGVAPANTPMSHVRLVLSRTAAQQADLDKYGADLLDKSSPNYHQWLTPEEFGRLYGPADSDIEAIVAWLRSHGLQVDPIAPGRTNISFSGTVQQIEEALHTSIHTYEVNGENILANSTNPSIPAALAPVISGVARLNTIRPKPHLVRGGSGFFDPSSGRMHATPPASKGPRADLTLGSGKSSDPYNLFLTPADAATIYDTPNSVLNANFASGGTNYTGSGVKIGIGGDAPINAGTVALYRQRFIGDSAQPTITYCTDITAAPGGETCSGSSAGLTLKANDQDEAYLDTEVSGGLAPAATIYYYASGDLLGAIDYAINQNLVDIFSLSFGGCEQDWGTGGNQLLNSFWQQAAMQGIAVTVSTGDSGPAGCDYPDPTKTQVAQLGFAVSAFASTPYNIAVGGTDFSGLVTSFTTYAATTNDAATLYRTALKYIPESSWNDSTTSNTKLNVNIPFTNSSGFTNIFAAAGGKSSCSVTTSTGSCTTGYPKPTWQRGTGVPNDGARDLPDVSLMSGALGNASAWAICDDTDNCSTQNNSFSFAAIGGTSAATPAFAGMLALVQQKTGSRLGQAAKELYDLYNGPHASLIFHDITVGNISVPCAAGTLNCQNNSKGHPFLTGYDTTSAPTAGYDLATGLGSVDVNNLVTYWGTSIGTAASTVTVTPAFPTVTSNASLDVTATVAGASGTPTGTVTLSGGGYTSTAQTLDSTGKFVFTIPPYSFTSAGVVTLTVNYSGDATYNTASGTQTITVTLSTFTLAATDVTLTAGASSANVSNVTVTPVAGYTGTVTLTAAVISGPSGGAPPTFTGSSVVITDSTAKAGTITVATTAASAVRVASNRGAAWFKAAGGTAITALLFFFLPLGSRRGRRVFSALLLVIAATFTAVGCGGGGGGGGSQKSNPGVTVSTTKNTYATTDTIPVAVSVTGGATVATGTVTLTSGTYTSGAQNLTSGGLTITIPAKTFSAGTVTLSASYSGDSNYNSASGSSSSITISNPVTTAGAYTVTVTGTGGDAAHTTATTTFNLTVN